ncbi:MAG: hypothetical protein JW880_04955 [Candidatus Thermoplasmatota archaeon]|nr:hypothetical protein [Candidatus Thermoplasmatota archaeon]
MAEETVTMLDRMVMVLTMANTNPGTALTKATCSPTSAFSMVSLVISTDREA